MGLDEAVGGEVSVSRSHPLTLPLLALGPASSRALSRIDCAKSCVPVSLWIDAGFTLGIGRGKGGGKRRVPQKVHLTDEMGAG